MFSTFPNHDVRRRRHFSGENIPCNTFLHTIFFRGGVRLGPTAQGSISVWGRRSFFIPGGGGEDSGRCVNPRRGPLQAASGRLLHSSAKGKNLRCYTTCKGSIWVVRGSAAWTTLPDRAVQDGRMGVGGGPPLSQPTKRLPHEGNPQKKAPPSVVMVPLNKE